jgi:UrcA family protein
MTFRTLAAAAAAAVLVAPAAAMAASSTVQLKYDDLDLSTTKGMDELNKRADDAARQACSANSVKTGTILRSKAELECYKETRAKLTQLVAGLSAQNQRG